MNWTLGLPTKNAIKTLILLKFQAAPQGQSIKNPSSLELGPKLCIYSRGRRHNTHSYDLHEICKKKYQFEK